MASSSRSADGAVAAADWRLLVDSVASRRSHDARFYKPACLLAVLDGVAAGTLAPGDLVPEGVFSGFAALVAPVFPDRADMGWRPFWHLSNDGAWRFWNGERAVARADFGRMGRPTTPGQLLARADRAAVPPAMRPLWTSAPHRAALRRMLIDMLMADDADCQALARSIGRVDARRPPYHAADERHARVAQGRKSVGQGFGRSAAERAAIEARAMRVATALLDAEKWLVEDVSRSASFDLRCTRAGGERLFVEVKGTTGEGGRVILTAGEVAFARAHRDEMTLIVVSGITLTTAPDGAVAADGGSARVLRRWAPAPGDLDPISFMCRVAC